MLKVSVVITILNEERTIKKLLTSLLAQTREPNEIIIIDAGSTDRTIKIINEFQKKYNSLRLLVKPGANRSQGRNIAIERAYGPIIAVTDAGCIPKKDWLEKLTIPFEVKSVDVVSGYYKPKGKSLLQKIVAVYTCVLPHQLREDTFLPASRSIAFTKKIWKNAGSYPEELATCEDLIFVQKLKDKSAKFVLAKDAVVLWEQPDSWGKIFKQLFNYAKGDAQARYMPHLRKIALVWIRYFLGILVLLHLPLLLLFFIPQYLAWVIGKGYLHVKDKKALYMLPLLQLTSDVAVMSGSLVGLLKRKAVIQ